MSELIPSQARPVGAILLALGTILAMLVAPVCASLCAARTCSSGAGQAQCHDMASMEAGSGAQFAASHAACRTAAHPAVLAEPREASVHSQEARADFAPVSVNAAPGRGSASLQVSPGRGRVHRASFALPGALPPTTILRT